MICDQCETVAHCMKHGCVPKQPMPTKDEALKMALEALEAVLSDNQPYTHKSKAAITAIKQALAQPAPVQPDWKSEYLRAVELHCVTLDELREADAWIKNLEKLMADQDKILQRQTARIVDLQEHIENFDGEER